MVEHAELYILDTRTNYESVLTITYYKKKLLRPKLRVAEIYVIP